MLEQLGHRLDREVERLYQKCEAEGLRGMDITHAIEDQIDLSNVLKRCTPGWDGGFVIAVSPVVASRLAYGTRGESVRPSIMRMMRLSCWLPSVRLYKP